MNKMLQYQGILIYTMIVNDRYQRVMCGFKEIISMHQMTHETLVPFLMGWFMGKSFAG